MTHFLGRQAGAPLQPGPPLPAARSLQAAQICPAVTCPPGDDEGGHTPPSLHHTGGGGGGGGGAGSAQKGDIPERLLRPAGPPAL